MAALLAKRALSGAGRAGGRGAASSTLSATLPKPYLGTMTFGWNQASSAVEEDVAESMLKRYLEAGGTEIDTARIYSGGKTEIILGHALAKLGGLGTGITLGTKAHPSQLGGLSAKGIKSQFEASLKAMGVDRVGMLYLHQPDTDNDLAESLECVHELVEAGLVGGLGMSNYSAMEIERCVVACTTNGWTRPTVVQGLYNPLNRMVEDELLPLLRRENISFVAYNPLAAGLLSGKHRRDGEVLAGRFKGNPNYLPRFYTEPNFQAVENIRAQCDAHGWSLVPATYAWLMRHSVLDASLGDGLLLGASSTAQLEENLTACQSAATLPAPVVDAFNGAWPICRDGAFPYWRSYSRDHPGRESLDPGAAYDAKHAK